MGEIHGFERLELLTTCTVNSLFIYFRRRR